MYRREIVIGADRGGRKFSLVILYDSTIIKFNRKTKNSYFYRAFVENFNTGMIEQMFVVAFIVFAIYITMQEGMIFEFIPKLFKWVPEHWQQPIYSCVICCTFWHGMYVYWIVYGKSWPDCFLTIIAAMGINTVFAKMFPKEDDE